MAAQRRSINSYQPTIPTRAHSKHYLAPLFLVKIGLERLAPVFVHEETEHAHDRNSGYDERAEQPREIPEISAECRDRDRSERLADRRKRGAQPNREAGEHHSAD